MSYRPNCRSVRHLVSGRQLIFAAEDVNTLKHKYNDGERRHRRTLTHGVDGKATRPLELTFLLS
jgi:hypothetical protein